jgi:hypothetical protein
MKKLLSYLGYFVITIAVTHLASCTKTSSTKNAGVSIDDVKINKSCQIQRFGQKSGFGDVLTYANVTYNKHGQPLTVIYDNLDNITPWRFFEYDKSHRLIEYRAEWGPGREFYTEIHRYGYRGNLIVIDTAYLQVEGTFNLIYYLTYDNHKRVISQDEYILHDDGTTSFFRTVDYDYGSDGNLVIENQFYDNNPSYMSTNKIWMFVNRNYSTNNFAGALTYNDQGLPLTYGQSSGSFLGNSNPDIIEYDCK